MLASWRTSTTRGCSGATCEHWSFCFSRFAQLTCCEPWQLQAAEQQKAIWNLWKAWLMDQLIPQKTNFPDLRTRRIRALPCARASRSVFAAPTIHQPMMRNCGLRLRSTSTWQIQDQFLCCFPRVTSVSCSVCTSKFKIDIYLYHSFVHASGVPPNQSDGWLFRGTPVFSVGLLDFFCRVFFWSFCTILQVNR